MRDSYTIVRIGSAFQVRRDVPGGGTAAAFHGIRFASVALARRAVLSAMGDGVARGSAGGAGAVVSE